MKAQNERELINLKTNIFDSIDHLIKNDPSKHIIIPNICTIMNKNISGFSKELYKKYPSVMSNIDINYKPKTLCSYSVVYRHPLTRAQLIVANMYCQNYKRKKRPINYGHLVLCMYEVQKLINNLKQQFPDFSTEIHCCKFGVGGAGGDWYIISELVTDVWCDTQVFVYQSSLKKTINNAS